MGVPQGSQPLTSGASFVAYPVAMPMGDHPYAVCEVKYSDRHFGRSTKVETQPVKEGDTLNPVWNETLELEPWHQGEPLEFTIYDKGLLGSKTEGTVTLPGELFFSNPMGFSGALPISGLSQALL